MHDTGKEDHERIMVFGGNEKVKYLQSSPSWLADGTLKSSPKIFYQLYTVHNQGPGIAPACVHGFLPNKTESTSKGFLDILLSLLPKAVSDNVLIDFELAAMKAVKKALPNATLSGCFFHLSQNFVRYRFYQTAGTQLLRKKSTENWRRRWKTQLNVIKMKIQLPSSERWLPCQCQIEHSE